MSDDKDEKDQTLRDRLSRRSILGMGSGVLAAAVTRLDRLTTSRRLLKLALSIGAVLEGSTHSAVRNAFNGGITQEEIDHVALLAVSTLGMSAAMRALTWIRDKRQG